MVLLVKLGFYKFSTDSTSHVASVTAVTKADITALGIPGVNTNTTYTFANGTAGNFTVTPFGGSNKQLVLVNLLLLVQLILLLNGLLLVLSQLVVV